MTNHRKQLPLINPYDAPESDPTTVRDSAARVQPPIPSTHRRPDPAPSVSTISDQGDVLVLPDDALVVLRKSGGLIFSSREIVVYRDGRITRRGQGGGQKRFEDATQRLPSEQLAELTKLVKRVKFPLAAGSAHQSPDTFVYEIAARVGRTLKTTEIAQNNVPAALKALIGWLDQRLSHSNA